MVHCRRKHDREYFDVTFESMLQNDDVFSLLSRTAWWPASLHPVLHDGQDSRIGVIRVLTEIHD